MQLYENNAELSELNSFSRKLNPDVPIKDRLIIRHLRQGKNNLLTDFDEPTSSNIDFGVNHE
jgi:hypothetical protein